MSDISAVIRVGRIAAAFACAAFLGGCGGGVELEGKIFDYAGLSGTVGEKKADPKMSSRAPLMVPPDTNRLPTPSEGRSVAATRQDWPDDPEKVRVREIEQQKTAEADRAKSDDPMNPYAGKETLLDKLFKGRTKTVTEPVPDVPEPDASDAIPGSAVAQRRQPISPHQNQAPLPDQNADAFKPKTPNTYQGTGPSVRAAY